MIKKYKYLLPAFVLLVVSLYTFISCGNYELLNIQHYLGLAAAALCVISFFAFRKFYKYVLAATLLLGIFNLLNFTPSHITAFIGISGLRISWQPFSLYVIILTIIVALPKRSEVEVVNSEVLSTLSEKQFNEDLNRFKDLFASKSVSDLSEIIEDKRFTGAAKEAARQILNAQQSLKPNL